jgi:hypothetical protein
MAELEKAAIDPADVTVLVRRSEKMSADLQKQLFAEGVGLFGGLCEHPVYAKKSPLRETRTGS